MVNIDNQGLSALIARGRMKHSYPHSWRSKAPLIFRNTPQWFISMEANDLRDNENLELIEASVLDLSDAELEHHVGDCSAVASCLGHNLSFRGLYGHPRRLVTEATRRLDVARSYVYTLMKTLGVDRFGRIDGDDD